MSGFADEISLRVRDLGLKPGSLLVATPSSPDASLPRAFCGFLSEELARAVPQGVAVIVAHKDVVSIEAVHPRVTPLMPPAIAQGYRQGWHDAVRLIGQRLTNPHPQTVIDIDQEPA